MKRCYVAVVLLGLIGMTTNAHAADCRVNGGGWQSVGHGQTINLHVPVTVRVGSDRTRLLLEGASLQCRFSLGQPGAPQYTDYWGTAVQAGNPWVPGPKFNNQGTGLRINGSFYNTPVPFGIRLASMPNNGVGYPIEATPYILLRNDPSNPIDIRIGDVLGTLNLHQTNNYNLTNTRLILTYSAANNFGLTPSTCTINNNNPLEINFGTVHQRAIGTDPLTTTIRSDRRLAYSCPDGGITTPITITYKGSPSAFDTRLLVMTNPDVGTAMLRNGAAVQVGGAFRTNINNSTGGDDVTFALVRRAGSLPTTGAVTGSGVLVMGVP